ncbi:MAG TPA: hypothetical protein VLB72_12615 [Burkholderiales bacterium]|nr:hypothetical protein [Burkholderiales bacterium]
MDIVRAGLALALVLGATSGEAAVSAQSARLEQMRKAVKASPSAESEKAYLAAFPSSYLAFRATFYGENLDELYPTHDEHLQLLQELQRKYPNEVLAIWFGVAAGAKWDADALGILQHQLAGWGAANTKALAVALNARTPSQRRSIVRFLADVENHSAYSDYDLILKNLKVLGFDELYKEFLTARASRMKRRDH